MGAGRHAPHFAQSSITPLKFVPGKGAMTYCISLGCDPQLPCVNLLMTRTATPNGGKGGGDDSPSADLGNEPSRPIHTYSLRVGFDAVPPTPGFLSVYDHEDLSDNATAAGSRGDSGQSMYWFDLTYRHPLHSGEGPSAGQLGRTNPPHSIGAGGLLGQVQECSI